MCPNVDLESLQCVADLPIGHVAERLCTKLDEEMEDREEAEETTLDKDPVALMLVLSLIVHKARQGRSGHERKCRPVVPKVMRGRDQEVADQLEVKTFKSVY